MTKIIGRASRKISAKEKSAMKEVLEAQGVEFIDSPMGEGKADIMSDDAADVIKALFDDVHEVKFP